MKVIKIMKIQLLGHSIRYNTLIINSLGRKTVWEEKTLIKIPGQCNDNNGNRELNRIVKDKNAVCVNKDDEDLDA